MPRAPLTGTLSALVTPFRRQEIAFDDLARLVAYQIKGGIDGLVPVGTTGESPTLNYREHMDVVRAVIEAAGGRVPVIAGTGSNSTAEALELTRLSHEAGADGMLIVAPYYNRPSPEGVYRHFAALAEATDKPIILYSIPSRCAIEITVPVLERLRAKYPNVCYIKESGGNVDRVDQIKQALGRDMTVLCGDDSLTLPFMAVGAEGVISVASNLWVREVCRLVSLALKGEYSAARRLHRRLYPVFRGIFAEPNPAPIKAALARVGIIGSAEVRPPLVEMSPAGARVLSRTIADAGL